MWILWISPGEVFSATDRTEYCSSFMSLYRLIASVSTFGPLFFRLSFIIQSILPFVVVADWLTGAGLNMGDRSWYFFFSCARLGSDPLTQV